MHRTICVVLTIATLATSAMAEGTQYVTVLGVGNRTCGEWLQARQPPGLFADVYEGWIAGFLTASDNYILHEMNVDIFATGTDAPGLWAWMDNHCGQHPLNTVATAADALAAELTVRAARR